MSPDAQDIGVELNEDMRHLVADWMPRAEAAGLSAEEAVTSILASFLNNAAEFAKHINMTREQFEKTVDVVVTGVWEGPDAMAEKTLDLIGADEQQRAELKAKVKDLLSEERAVQGDEKPAAAPTEEIIDGPAQASGLHTILAAAKVTGFVVSSVDDLATEAAKQGQHDLPLNVLVWTIVQAVIAAAANLAKHGQKAVKDWHEKTGRKTSDVLIWDKDALVEQMEIAATAVFDGTEAALEKTRESFAKSKERAAAKEQAGSSDLAPSTETANKQAA